MLKLFSPTTNSVIRDNGLHSRPADWMKSTSQHWRAFINKLGFQLWLPTDFRRGSCLTTKRHGPSGLPLADREEFGAFKRGTLASEFIVAASL